MLNKITIMGRLTDDPELRYTQSQTPVASFTIACERDFGDKATDFIPCVAWRQTGEFVDKYFHKGSLIAMTGSLQSRKWEDKNGNKRVSWEVNVDHAYFTGEKQDAPKPPELVEIDESDGEFPF